MKLKRMAIIHPGHLTREKIHPTKAGSHWLVQGRDVMAGVLHFQTEAVIRFNPKLSSRDILLRDDDILFMARGVKNYAAILREVPDQALAAASFFVIRVLSENLDPVYLTWYLNQPKAQHYFNQNSGRGVQMPVVRRSVLEQMNAPFPPLSTQKLIGKLYCLSMDEQELTKNLLTKRIKLIEKVCLRAAEREGT